MVSNKSWATDLTVSGIREIKMKTFEQINKELCNERDKATYKEIVSVWAVSVVVFGITGQIATTIALYIANIAGL